MRQSPELVLASRSPRRAELLERIGFSFVASSGDCDESWRPGETPEDYVCRVAENKADACQHQLSDEREALVLSADTTVWIPEDPGPPLGKPRDWAEAESLLRRLFDCEEHRVSTAICLQHRAHAGPADTRTQLVTTKVWMRQPATVELECYRRSQEWTDKAGAYGIQGFAAAFITAIEGSHSSVIGLPLAECIELLAGYGISPRPGG